VFDRHFRPAAVSGSFYLLEKRDQ